MPSRNVPLAGVTGGIGSGKSTACFFLEQLGRTVISADRIARDLTEKDESVRAAISREFGAAMYDARGNLQRSALARVVFGDSARLRTLNAIVHPRVFESLREMISGIAPGAAAPYVAVEAALIFESGMEKDLDATIVVNAPEEVRIARVLGRGNRLSRDEVIARMRSQLPPETIARRADFVIENAGTVEELRGRVEFVDRILSMTIGKGELPATHGKRRLSTT